ncbi:hypothetical protein CPLU01_00899 [Colletotrichum plurivorum]|uniref:Uncharacterized protein n=1 Tax=Colletotrichum plurivorum TaxID=2175906 RepID=A0A8H6NR01_9PEZI|nr:hypothetical protein CPLU01_00899 [Colletotrichum plurivorum]
MDEDELRGQGRQLRQSTLGHQPGQYTELPAHGVERPALTIPDPVYDPELARHCAFPSIPLGQHPGPCEVFEAERARRQSAPEHSEDEHITSSANYSDQSDQDDNTQLVPISAETQEGEENKSSPGPGAPGNEFISRGLNRGESFKEFSLAVTNDLDWASPEPEEQPKPQEKILGMSMFAVSQDISWSELSEGVQWVLIATACQSRPFSLVTQLLRLTSDQCNSFVQNYIRYSDADALWSKKVEQMPVSDLLQYSRGDHLSTDQSGNLNRPALPTDLVTEHDLDRARAYLIKIRREDLCLPLRDWRGTSRAFVVLPINAEIIIKCRSAMTTATAHHPPSDFHCTQVQKPSPKRGFSLGIHSLPELPGLGDCSDFQVLEPSPTRASSPGLHSLPEHSDSVQGIDCLEHPDYFLECPGINCGVGEHSIDCPLPTWTSTSNPVSPESQHENRQTQANTGLPSTLVAASKLSAILELEKIPKLPDLHPAGASDKQRKWKLENNPEEKMEYDKYARMSIGGNKRLEYNQSSLEHPARLNHFGSQGGTSEVDTRSSTWDEVSTPNRWHTQVAQKAVEERQTVSRGLHSFADSRAARDDGASHSHRPASSHQPSFILPPPRASLNTFTNNDAMRNGNQQSMPIGFQHHGRFAGVPAHPQHYGPYTAHTQHRQCVPTNGQHTGNFMMPPPQNVPMGLQYPAHTHHYGPHTEPTRQYQPTDRQYPGNFMMPAQQQVPIGLQHPVHSQHYRPHTGPPQQHVSTDRRYFGHCMGPVPQNVPTGFQHRGSPVNPAQHNIPTGLQHHGNLAKPAQQNMPTDLQKRVTFDKPLRQSMPNTFQHRGNPAEPTHNIPMDVQHRDDLAKPAQQNMPTDLRQRSTLAETSQQSMSTELHQSGSPVALEPASQLATSPEKRRSNPKPPYVSMADDLEDDGPGIFISVAARHAHNVLAINSGDNRSAKPNRKRPAEESDEDYQPRAKKPRKSNPQKPIVKKKAAEAQGDQAQIQTTGGAAEQQPSASGLLTQPVKRGRGRPRKYPRDEELAAQAHVSQQGGNPAPVGPKAAPKRRTAKGQKNASSHAKADLESSATESSGAFGDMAGSIQPTAPKPVKLASEYDIETSTTAAKISSLKVAPTNDGAASADAPSSLSATQEPDYHSPVASQSMQTHATLAFDDSLATISDPIAASVSGQYAKQIAGQNDINGHVRSPQCETYDEFWKKHENGKKLMDEATARGAEARKTMQGPQEFRSESNTSRQVSGDSPQAPPATAPNWPTHDSLIRQTATAAATQRVPGPHSGQPPMQEGIGAHNSVGSVSNASASEKPSLPGFNRLAPIRCPSYMETIEKQIEAEKRAAAEAEKNLKTSSN